MKSGAENHFTVRLGHIHAPSGSRKFVKLAGQVRRAARQFGTASGRTGTGRAGRSTASFFQRRVIVKISIVKMAGKGTARQAAHIEYIGRETAGKDGDRGWLYDRSGRLENADDFLARTKDDPHQFRIIVSPEDSLT